MKRSKENLLVMKSLVYEYLHKEGLQVALEVYEVVDIEVKRILSRAAYRARENFRKTVQGRDI